MFRPYVSKPGLHYASFLGILLQSYVLLADGAGWVSAGLAVLSAGLAILSGSTVAPCLCLPAPAFCLPVPAFACCLLGLPWALLVGLCLV